MRFRECFLSPRDRTQGQSSCPIIFLSNRFTPMPTDCPITFPKLSDDEMRTIDYAVMGHAFATHPGLGRLCDESVYQHELLQRLQTAGIEAAIEIPVTLSHRDFSIRRALDLVVQQRVIYELKTVSALSLAHKAQVLEYLFLTNATRGNGHGRS